LDEPCSEYRAAAPTETSACYDCTATQSSTTTPATAAVEAVRELVGWGFIEDAAVNQVTELLSRYLPAQQPEVETEKDLRERLARCEGSRRVHELDNHHNALACGYCAGPIKEEVERLTREVEHLKSLNHLKSQEIANSEKYQAAVLSRRDEREAIRLTDTDEVERLKGEVERLTKLNDELKIIVDVGTNDDPATALSKLHKIQYVARADAIGACVQRVLDMGTKWYNAARARGAAFSDKARLAREIAVALEALKEKKDSQETSDQT
jgi:hypothetical protein